MKCESALDLSCRAAPSTEEGSTRGICFGCGLPVCVSCSRRTSWYSYGHKRICAGCLENHGKGDLVAQLLWKNAGYSGPPAAWLVAMFKGSST